MASVLKPALSGGAVAFLSPYIQKKSPKELRLDNCFKLPSRKQVMLGVVQGAASYANSEIFQALKKYIPESVPANVVDALITAAISTGVQKFAIDDGQTSVLYFFLLSLASEMAAEKAAEWFKWDCSCKTSANVSSPASRSTVAAAAKPAPGAGRAIN
jgi:hypothetical protein